MTIGPRSQCDACSRPLPREGWGRLACRAFPDGIPDPVFDNEVDHRQPVDGDHDIQFQAKAGDEFPEYAFT